MSHEKSITIEMDGRHINIPTVVGGRQVSDDEAVAAFRSGAIKPLGVFGSQEEALSAASARSQAAGRTLEDRLRAAQAAGSSGGGLAERLDRARQALTVAPIPEPIAMPRPEGNPTIAFTESALRRFADNIIGLPETVVNTGLGLAGSDKRVDFMPDLNQIAAVRQARDRAVASFFKGEDVDFRKLIQEEMGANANRTMAQQEMNPTASGAGEFAADMATVLTGRGGVRAARGGSLTEAAPKVAAQAQTVMGRALQALGRTAKKAGGRAAETGMEGAFLAALQNADPQQVAAMGAGGQVIGDMSAAAFRKLAQPKTLLTAIALGTVGSLGLQQLTPGGLNRLLPTIEDKNKEAILTLLLSGTGAAALGGKVPKDFGGAAFAELANVTRRGAVLSLLGSLAKDPVQTAPVVQKFTEDPDYFGPRAKRLLTRAINSEEIDVRNTVESLMKDRAFKKKFQSLDVDGQSVVPGQNGGAGPE